VSECEREKGKKEEKEKEAYFLFPSKKKWRPNRKEKVSKADPTN
jgi:hypothetical protein